MIKPIQAWVPLDDHTQFKSRCATNEISMSAQLAALVREFLARDDSAQPAACEIAEGEG